MNARSFNMNSVGGKTIKTSTRKLNRLARRRGFRDHVAMYAAMVRKLAAQHGAARTNVSGPTYQQLKEAA